MSEKSIKKINTKRNVDYEFLSFNENVFTKFKSLTVSQRKKAQSIFKECLYYMDDIPELKKILKTLNFQSYSEKLLSNLIISSSHPNYIDSISLKHGICILLLSMQKNKKRELKLIKDILFFDIEVQKLTNKKLFELYRKTLKNKSVAISLLDKEEYSKIYNENMILEIKRRDILNEFFRRSKVSKVCELVNSEDVSQGKAHFIPKTEQDDIIIVMYKNEPCRLCDIKKMKLFTKRVNGKIFWK